MKKQGKSTLDIEKVRELVTILQHEFEEKAVQDPFYGECHQEAVRVYQLLNKESLSSDIKISGSISNFFAQVKILENRYSRSVTKEEKQWMKELDALFTSAKDLNLGWMLSTGMFR